MVNRPPPPPLATRGSLSTPVHAWEDDVVLVGYFHIPGAVVPHVRFLSSASEDDVILALEAALHRPRAVALALETL